MDSLFRSSSLQICSIVALLAVLWSAILILRGRRRSLRLPPGPIGLPIVGSLPFLHRELRTYFTQLAQTYGPIYRIKLGTKLGIILSTPALAREVYRDNDSVLANRDVPAAARVIAYGGSDIGWSPLGPTWRMLRRVCAREMLNPSSLDAMYFLRRQEVRATVHHLWNMVGEPTDIGAQMFVTSLNVMTNMMWGSTMEGVEERSRVGKEFRELAGQITELVGVPNVSDFFPFLARFDLQGIERRMGVLKERFDQIFSSIIDMRRVGKGEIGKKDFLEIMLRMEAVGGDSKIPFTMTHVKALLMDMVIGGTETTSNTMEWAMAEMMQNPEIMKRVQEELDLVVGKDNIVEESHIPKLHYLAAVIKEVLRLHPTLPLLIPHSPSSPCTIGGYTIPQGSRVFLNVWSIHKDPSVWPDPLEFRPERFLAPTRKWDFNGGDFSYFPFGSGKRICPGILLAERMTTYLLASLLHSFDWKLPVGTKLDLTENFGIVLKKAEPLVAIPTPRLPQPDQYT